jgi:triacylglycerol lipase
MTAQTAAVAAAAGAGVRAGSPSGLFDAAIGGVVDGVLGGVRSGVRARWAGARSAAAAVAEQVRPALSPAGVRGAVLETAWLSAHLAIYPFGLVAERGAHPDRYHLDSLDPVQRGLVVGDVEAAGTPILLVHGMVDNRAVFTVLKRRLRRRGFGRVVTINYSPTTNDVRRAARELAVQVEALVAETGYERIHVVGHSMGGLIARYYVQRLGGDERVHTLVTLGTPHGGSLPAHLLPVTVCRQLRPGSDLLAELDAPAPGCRTRFVAFWSDLDQMVLPHHHGRLEHPDLSARNVLVRAVGHMSIPLDGRVVREISTLLSQLDADGATVTAGVTSMLDAVPSGRERRAGARAAATA